MRVLITGGSGLIGHALSADLATAGHEVIVLSRRPEQVAGLPSGVRAERWDSRTGQGWSSLINGDTAIVNLAGESLSAGRWTDESKQKILQSRLSAGQAVVQAVQAAPLKPSVVLQASAVGYYGPRGDEEVTEEAPPGSGFLPGVAVQWEASTAPVEAWGVRRVVTRSGVVLSLKGGAFPRLLQPYRFFVGGPLGSGRQWFSWIHLADEAGAMRFLLENPAAQGAFNLTSLQPLTNAAFGKVLGRVLGRPSLIPVPALALRLLFGEMSTVLLDGQRVLPSRLLALGYQFRFPQAEVALRNLLKEVEAA